MVASQARTGNLHIYKEFVDPVERYIVSMLKRSREDDALGPKAPVGDKAETGDVGGQGEGEAEGEGEAAPAAGVEETKGSE